MGKFHPDRWIERDGVGLEEWLWRLFDEDGSMRAAARDFLYTLTQTAPKEQSFDPNQTGESVEDLYPFRAFREIKAIVDSPGFQTEEFLVAVGLYFLVLRENAREVPDHSQKPVNRKSRRLKAAQKKNSPQQPWDELRETPGESTAEIAYRIVQSMPCGRTESELTEAEERLRKWLDYFEHHGFESDLDQQGVVSRILHLSKFPILKVPELISLFMEHRSGVEFVSWISWNTIPASQRFVSDLLNRVLASRKMWKAIPATLLGSFSRDDPRVAGLLLEMIRSDDPKEQERGLKSLVGMRPELGDYHSEILKRILELQTSQSNWFCVQALASVGRDDPEIRAMVLEMAKPCPPRIVTIEIGAHRKSSWSYDEAMEDRSSALEAIRYFVDYPDEAVPVLIEALGSFEEFDPDYMYDGTCVRVSEILEAFGPAAGPWAYRMAEEYQARVRRGEYPQGLLRALGAMGPAAGAALTILEPMSVDEIALRRKLVEESLWEEPGLCPDEFDFPVGWTIYRIKGGE
ncbi:MAG: hypothetical protein KDA68_09650 [Planctomycetaceae bacterium]|nr:hypothetical protein [Planctomycetaceae bacterium]